MRNSKLLWVSLISLLTFGCIQDAVNTIDDLNDLNRITMDPGIAVPLVSSSINLGDLLKQVGENDFVYIDEDNLIHLKYRGELFSLTPSDFLSIPDQSVRGSVAMNPLQIAAFNSSGTVSTTYRLTLPFDADPVEIDSMLMLVCNAVLNVNSDIPHDVSIVLSIPEIRLNGQGFKLNVDLPKGSSNQTISTNLNSYWIDCTKSFVEPFNHLDLEFTIRIDRNGSDPLTSTQEIDVDFGLLYNEYNEFYGYANNQNVSALTVDTFDIPALNDYVSGDFGLSDPRIKIIMENSLGVAVQAKPLVFRAVTNQGEVDITGIPDPLNLPRPADKSEIGVSYSDSVVLDGSNSNLGTVLNTGTKQVIYDFDVQVNPAGTVGRNFASRPDEAKVIVDVDIPLHGYADGLILEETRPFELETSDLENLDMLEEAMLRIYLENEFPIDLGVQLYFEDDNGNVLDSLINPYSLLLESATVGTQGEIISKTTSTKDITVKGTQLEDIKLAKQIRIRVTLNTFKEGGNVVPVKLFSTYDLFIKMGLQAKANIDQEL
jgi:hypothetical protein